jgi:ATP adenylyltransferase
MRYIAAADAPAGCLFCRVARGKTDRADLVLTRRPHALLMLNRFPYNPAHLMVAVVRHVPQFERLDADERADLMDLVAVAERALARAYRPHGINYGANVGRIAGAGFPGHLHLHLVPRWNGDTNFMPVIGETRVLPESLAQTWSRLREAIGGATAARPRRSTAVRRPRRAAAGARRRPRGASR